MKYLTQSIRLLRFLTLISCSSVTQTAPIRTTFDGCKPGVSAGVTYHCCPPKPGRPIVDFKPEFNSSRPLRMRRALQCLDELEFSVYRQKLERAYMILRALPADDPRSFHQHHVMHCAYGTGSLNNGEEGIDIHFSWHFNPWHRWFLYFHERILQSLLDDPTFTIHFWNWDNDGAPVAGRRGCLKAGNRFPAMYADPSSPLFHPTRSVRARVPSQIVDVAIVMETASDFTLMESLPEDFVRARNAEKLHSVMMNSTTHVFLGRSYRAGDKRVEKAADGIGSLEKTGHSTVHFWIGGDMFKTSTAAKDPIFFAHHGNVERLWHMWHILSPGKENLADPDFLDAEFLFYDENADLNRVKVRDCLDTRALGYYYEETDDASWNYGSEKTEADDFLVGRSESLFASKLVQG